MHYPPTLLRGKGWTGEETNRLKRLQTAFDLPYAWVFTSGAGPNSTARTAMGAANRNGVVSVLAELGGGGALDPAILAATERGLHRILHTLGHLPVYVPDTTKGTREMHAQGTVYTYDAGVFVPGFDTCPVVEAGQMIGRVHTPDTPWRSALAVVSPYTGIVLAKRVPAEVQRGDAVAQIFRDAEPS